MELPDLGRGASGLADRHGLLIRPAGCLWLRRVRREEAPEDLAREAEKPQPLHCGGRCKGFTVFTGLGYLRERSQPGRTRPLVDVFVHQGKPYMERFRSLKEGLYDLVGNVWEWTASPYQGADRDMCVLWGASWINMSEGSTNHRAWITTRMGNTPDSASDNLGFRCASSIGRCLGAVSNHASQGEDPLRHLCCSLAAFQTQADSSSSASASGVTAPIPL
ncbi:inactive C-alpha-formylglycine-generating enzyme 2-like [Glossophaga mutica]